MGNLVRYGVRRSKPAPCVRRRAGAARTCPLTSAPRRNGITERDGETIRRVATLLRYFGRRGFLQSSDWTPHTAEVLQMQAGVFGSAFPAPGGEVVYALVNRKAASIRAAQLAPAKPAGLRWYDCWRGVELKPSAGQLSFEIEARDFMSI